MIETFIWIWVTSGTSVLETGCQAFGCSIIACWNYTILAVDNNCTNWAFHAIRSSTSDICNFHKIFFPGWSKGFEYLLFFVFNLLMEKQEALPVTDSGFNEIETLFELFIILPVIFFDEFLQLLGSVFNWGFNKVILVSFVGWCFYKYDIDKVPFFEGFQKLVVGLLQHVYSSSMIVVETEFGYSFGCLLLLFG